MRKIKKSVPNRTEPNSKVCSGIDAAIRNSGVVIGENSTFIDDYANRIRDFPSIPILNIGYIHLVNCSYFSHGKKILDLCYCEGTKLNASTETDNIKEYTYWHTKQKGDGDTQWTRECNGSRISISEAYKSMLPIITSTNNEISELDPLYDYYYISKPTNNLLQNRTIFKNNLYAT